MEYEEFIAVGPYANILRLLRVSMNWSIRDAAKELGISASYISEVEKERKYHRKRF